MGAILVGECAENPRVRVVDFLIMRRVVRGRFCRSSAAVLWTFGGRLADVCQALGRRLENARRAFGTPPKSASWRARHGRSGRRRVRTRGSVPRGAHTRAPSFDSRSRLRLPYVRRLWHTRKGNGLPPSPKEHAMDRVRAPSERFASHKWKLCEPLATGPHAVEACDTWGLYVCGGCGRLAKTPVRKKRALDLPDGNCLSKPVRKARAS